MYAEHSLNEFTFVFPLLIRLLCDQCAGPQLENPEAGGKGGHIFLRTSSLCRGICWLCWGVARARQGTREGLGPELPEGVGKLVQDGGGEKVDARTMSKVSQRDLMLDCHVA